MIGRLRGILAEKQPPQLLIDVNGVGYEVEAPMSTIYQLPDCGEEVSLQIHMVVREDAQLLFGFFSEEDRSLFRSLIKVNGIGAKLALTILSGMSVAEFVCAIRAEDSTTLIRIPGIGKKSAERLIIEMRDRLKDWDDRTGEGSSLTSVTAASSATVVTFTTPAASQADAVSALIALGYKPPQASQLVAKVASDEMDSEALIRAALRLAIQS